VPSVVMIVMYGFAVEAMSRHDNENSTASCRQHKNASSAPGPATLWRYRCRVEK
jgi:hypothetical protein